LINGVCNCPLGSYSNDVSCVACPDYKCLNCTVSICTSCMKGYYASSASCLSCINDCLECSDSASCSVCNVNYIFYNGKCTYFGNGFAGTSNSVSNIYTCPAGCDSCSLGVNNILACTVLTPGYSFSGSNLIKCDGMCFSCAK
jgi:proprotein convertase subtilisin/kexin type 5